MKNKPIQVKTYIPVGNTCALSLVQSQLKSVSAITSSRLSKYAIFRTKIKYLIFTFLRKTCSNSIVSSQNVHSYWKHLRIHVSLNKQRNWSPYQDKLHLSKNEHFKSCTFKNALFAHTQKPVKNKPIQVKTYIPVGNTCALSLVQSQLKLVSAITSSRLSKYALL